MAYDSQVVNAKENLKSNRGGPNKGQASGTNPLKLCVRATIESEVWPTIVQLERKPKR